MSPRPIRTEGDLAYVPLTQGKTAVVDAADVPLVEGSNWFALNFAGKFYAGKKEKLPDGRRRVTYMHRLIAGTPQGMDTDHINRDALDNRRANLRHATRSENNMNRCTQKSNTSGFKGVSIHTQERKWQAHIRVSAKLKFLGFHPTAEAAHEAYCQAAKKFHGEFARTA